MKDADVIDVIDTKPDTKPDTPSASVKTTAPTAPPGARLVDPFTYAAEQRRSTGFFEGDFVQCNGNTGEWTRGGKPIGESETFLANLHEALWGWTYFGKDGPDPEKRKLGRIIDGHPPPAPEQREALGDLEKYRWPYPDRDPWKPSCYLPLKDSNGELCCFTSINDSGVEALQRLCGIYGREGADRGGKLPVLRLGTFSYDNKQYRKRVYKPTLTIVAWDLWDGEPAPPVQPIAVPIAAPAKSATAKLSASAGAKRGDMDDEIPF